MSGWSRTTKPSADTTIPSAEIFGVDTGEVAANVGIAQGGWVRKRTVGTRTLYETLVAMKSGPTETADDADIRDFRIVITSNPQNLSVAAPAPAVFTVVAETAPTGGTLTYQWEVSTNGGGSWANAASTTATLTLANSTGLNNNRYRCVISVAGGVSVTSAAAILTVT